MFIDWESPQVLERRTSGKRPVRRETRYRVVCSCGTERWLKRADAQHAAEHQSCCQACARRENGKRAYARLVEAHGHDYANGKARQWRMERPSKGEAAIMAMLDARGIAYEREVEVRAGAFGRVWVDFRLADGLIIEFHGGVHALPHLQERDALRLAALRQSGQRVLVVQERDLQVFPVILKEVQYGIRPVA